jgi:hypothetical protein
MKIESLNAAAVVKTSAAKVVTTRATQVRTIDAKDLPKVVGGTAANHGLVTAATVKHFDEESARQQGVGSVLDGLSFWHP